MPSPLRTPTARKQDREEQETITVGDEPVSSSKCLRFSEASHLYLDPAACTSHSTPVQPGRQAFVIRRVSPILTENLNAGSGSLVGRR